MRNGSWTKSTHITKRPQSEPARYHRASPYRDQYRVAHHTHAVAAKVNAREDAEGILPDLDAKPSGPPQSAADLAIQGRRPAGPQFLSKMMRQETFLIHSADSVEKERLGASFGGMPLDDSIAQSQAMDASEPGAHTPGSEIPSPEGGTESSMSIMAAIGASSARQQQELDAESASAKIGDRGDESASGTVPRTGVSSPPGPKRAPGPSPNIEISDADGAVRAQPTGGTSSPGLRRKPQTPKTVVFEGTAGDVRNASPMESSGVPVVTTSSG